MVGRKMTRLCMWCLWQDEWKAIGSNLVQITCSTTFEQSQNSHVGAEHHENTGVTSSKPYDPMSIF